jgi:hypothetical protein
MQPVFGFVENHRMRPIQHLVGDLLAAMRRQAVHEDGVGLGLGDQPAIDLIAFEQVVATCAIAVAHRDPGIRHHAIYAAHRLLGIGPKRDRGCGRFDPIRKRLLRRQFRRCRHP